MWPRSDLFNHSTWCICSRTRVPTPLTIFLGRLACLNVRIWFSKRSTINFSLARSTDFTWHTYSGSCQYLSLLLHFFAVLLSNCSISCFIPWPMSWGWDAHWCCKNVPRHVPYFKPDPRRSSLCEGWACASLEWELPRLAAWADSLQLTDFSYFWSACYFLKVE